jgi:hypothetical protein
MIAMTVVRSLGLMAEVSVVAGSIKERVRRASMSEVLSHTY